MEAPLASQAEDTIASAANNTGKFTPTLEGMACAYVSLMVMALVPIFVGSFKSIKHHIDTRAKCQETGEQAETMTDKDAAMFPLIASCALFSFYILIKLSPDLVNLILSGYFFMLGVIAIHRLLAPTTHRIFPTKYNSTQYAFLFASTNLNQDKNDTASETRSGTTSPSESQGSTDSELTRSNVDEQIHQLQLLPLVVAKSLLAKRGPTMAIGNGPSCSVQPACVCTCIQCRFEARDWRDSRELHLYGLKASPKSKSPASSSTPRPGRWRIALERLVPRQQSSSSRQTHSPSCRVPLPFSLSGTASHLPISQFAGPALGTQTTTTSSSCQTRRQHHWAGARLARDKSIIYT